ncbi:hypothetical protein A3K64_03095 [Candidatus Micrarchaeota archaeon RBG_16_36_9]|nr:MAG: hypothetical protein A3K64_03095 [Candidatus Micrarchaeota archaeon RBG_16_36_9]
MKDFKEIVESKMLARSNTMGPFTKLMSYLGEALPKKDNRIADILSGNNASMVYSGLGLIGKGGEFIMIDAREDFPYETVTNIAGKDFLPKPKDYYMNTESGKDDVRRVLSTIGVIPYVAKIPPYPQDIKPNSLDAVTCVNSLFEFQGDKKSLVEETEKLIRPGGVFLAQEWFFQDLQNLLRAGRETLSSHFDLITAKYENLYKSKWALLKKREIPRTSEEAKAQCWNFDLSEEMEEI